MELAGSAGSCCLAMQVLLDSAYCNQASHRRSDKGCARRRLTPYSSCDGDSMYAGSFVYCMDRTAVNQHGSVAFQLHQRCTGTIILPQWHPFAGVVSSPRCLLCTRRRTEYMTRYKAIFGSIKTSMPKLLPDNVMEMPASGSMICQVRQIQ